MSGLQRHNLPIPLQHSVIDVAYDYYGKRLATSSSDLYIRIWDLVLPSALQQQSGFDDANLNESGAAQWVCTATIRAHNAVATKLCWAHPEFGAVLASCSADRHVHIYQEQTEARTNRKIWKREADLHDGEAAVTEIGFAPAAHGLRLAAVSLDGFCRIYAAADVLNLSAWELTDQFAIPRSRAHCSMSWNPSPFDAPMLCIAAADRAGVWEYHAGLKRWQCVAELDHKNPALDAEADEFPDEDDEQLLEDASFLEHPDEELDPEGAEPEGLFGAEFGDGHFGSGAAVEDEDEDALRAFDDDEEEEEARQGGFGFPARRGQEPRAEQQRGPQQGGRGELAPGQDEVIRSVGWAPSLGRSFHLIATGGRQGRVRIFRFRILKSRGKYEVELLLSARHHLAQQQQQQQQLQQQRKGLNSARAGVWRVGWNTTGSLLASTGEDGAVRVWKSDYSGRWNAAIVAQAQPQKRN